MSKLLRIAGVLALSFGTARAATTTIDFNTDPSVSGIYTEQGVSAAVWRPDGGASGAAGDGYLSLADAKGNQRSVLVFADFENGLVIKSFSFECDLRIGGGTTPPADGFSLNYAGSTTENDLPEEGTQTGLAIGFDTWQSGDATDRRAAGGAAEDVAGITVSVDNTLLAQFPLPLQPGNIYLPTDPPPGSQGTKYTYNRDANVNLSTNDPNYHFTMQTGALSSHDLNGDGAVNASDAATPQPDDITDPTWGYWIENLRWEHFKAEIDETGKVKIE